jgi:beta-galactosidase
MTESVRVRLDGDWLFGGPIPLPGTVDRLNPAVIDPYAAQKLDTSSWQTVTLPHTVVPLSWQNWEPPKWEKVWVYRRTIDVPKERAGKRFFVDFEAVMTATTVYLNGTKLGEHRGGYLPFSFELTAGLLASGANILTVIVDSRFTINVPPNLPDPAHSSAIDFWQPGGIHRDVWLRTEPATFVSDIAMSHFDVIEPKLRRSTFEVHLDSSAEQNDVSVSIDLVDSAGTVVASTRSRAQTVNAGTSSVTVELRGLDAIELWDTESPVLYTVSATLRKSETALYSLSRRTGYREARWEKNGFFLNGTRRYLLGVNRHGYFPFTGFSMPDRVHRRDVQVMKDELNCVMVRCSHYPQTASFLDACDELGLLVWEESPGWQYIGDSSWQDAAAADMEGMIARDRHRPSIVIWGARLNETPDRPEFNARTEALVKSLDPTRATSGTMHGDYSRLATYHHDVFSYDDYNTAVDEDGERRPILLPPVDDRPYLISEGISSRSSPSTMYRRSEPARIQQHQALDYAYGHNDAMGDERFAGLLAWVGFDYHALMGNEYHGVKTSGLGDVFRILKPGAAIYRSQISPSERIVLEPAFTWDPPEFGQADAYGGRAEGKLWGPGEKAMICSNLDRIEAYIGDKRVGVATPDRKRFPHLAYAPSFVNLDLREHDSADLRLEGYLNDELVITRQYSGDRGGDSLALVADDDELIADGVDATRVTLKIVDKHGEARGMSRARVTLTISGPGTLVGDNPFDLEPTGAVGAVWVRSVAGEEGLITLHASTPGFALNAIGIATALPAATVSKGR